MSSDTFTSDELGSLDNDLDTPGAGARQASPAPSQSMQADDHADSAALDGSSFIQNLELLYDVDLPVTVELGRTISSVRHVLSLGESAIIELEKPANEPVDIFAGDRLVARGEVVVIDENFGVRITEIIDPQERLKLLS